MIKNILILSYADDRGDGIAAYMLTKILREAGNNAALMVTRKTRSDDFVILAKASSQQLSLQRRIIRKIRAKVKADPTHTALIKTDGKYDFYIDQELKPLFPAEVILSNLTFDPDLVLVGAMHDFVNTTTLAELKRRTGSAIYMLMTDMFPLTGGCQHAWDCTGYQRDCSNCPAILDEDYRDIASKNLAIKMKNVKEAGLKIIAGSGRTFEQAQQSSLFCKQDFIHNINSFIDDRVFNSKYRHIAKAVFDIPLGSKVLFTGAEYTGNERKGLRYFVEALNQLWNDLAENSKLNTYILIAGKSEGLKSNNIIKNIPFKKKFIDYITDDRLLSLAYQASDVYVCSSVEDPGPLMVSQALACGTPVVGFKMGLLYNMVINDVNGYKAELRNSVDLAIGLKKILSLSEAEYKQYSLNAVRQVEQYSSTKYLVSVVNMLTSNPD